MSIYLNGSVVSDASKPEWGNIEGEITSQTDLQAALDSKANTSDIPDVSNFATKSEIPTDYATKTEVTNGLATKQNTLSTAQLNAVNSGITSAKVTEINAKIPKTLGETIPTTNTNLNEYKAGEIYGGVLKNGFFTGMNMLCGNKNHFYKAPNNGYTITCNYGNSSWYQGTLFDGNMASGGYHVVTDMSVFKDNPFVLTIQKNSGTIDATDVLNLSFHGHRNWAPISGINSLIHSYKIETYVPASGQWETVCQAEGLTTANCPFKKSIPVFALFNNTNSTKTGTYNYNSPSAVRITFYGACVGYLDLSEIQLNESRGSTPFITAINGVSRGGDTILGDLTVNGTLRGSQVNSSGAVSATTSLNAQTIELKASTPLIDFHFNNSTADYTSRIIEETSGTLTITGGLKVNGTLTGTATKATGDGNGNIITETYATKDELKNASVSVGDSETIVNNESSGLDAIGVKSKSGKILYDWIGTREEYESGIVDGSISEDWVCWITDEEGGDKYRSMAIGSVFSVNANSNYVPEGCLPCDGAEYNKAQFEQLWDNYLIGKDVFDPDSITIVGNPTITDDGIASGFSKENCVRPTYDFNKASSANSWKVSFKNFKYIASSTNQNLFVNTEGNYSALAIFSYGKVVFNLNNGTTAISRLHSNTILVDGQNYDIDYVFTGTKYQIWINDILDAEENNTSKFPSQGTWGLGVSYNNGAYSLPIVGSIDLKQFSITVDGQTVFDCVKQVPLLNTCSYDEYEQDLATYGQCGKFAVDIDSLTFKVPTIKDGAVVQQAMSDSELGKAYNEGLPNIIGRIAVIGSGGTTDGAFSKTVKSAELTNTGEADWQADFDASRCSDVYGGTNETSLNKVQINAIALRYFVVVANGQTNQSLMDWSAWSSSLQGKLNADHSNDTKPYIVEVSDKSILPSWYRVYSDGWCEQGGYCSASMDVTFLKPFIDANYSLVGGLIPGVSSENYEHMNFKNQTATGFTFSTYDQYKVKWVASGYIK